MKTFLLLFIMFLVSPLAAQDHLSPADQYSKDHSEAKKSEQVWVLIIGGDW